MDETEPTIKDVGLLTDICDVLRTVPPSTHAHAQEPNDNICFLFGINQIKLNQGNEFLKASQ